MALISLVAVCMAVTTVGVYGFISRGYAERVATMTRSTDHALVEAGERVKLVEQNLDGIEHQITKLDAPETRTVKIKTAGRTTETVTPVAKDKTARATLEARRTQTAAELADLRVEVAGKQADRANVERELNTVRAIAQVVGLGNDPALAVNVLAGTLATLWDPFAVLLLLAATRQAPPAEKAKPTVRKSKSGRSDLPVKQKPTRKAPAKLKVANDNVVPFKPAA